VNVQQFSVATDPGTSGGNQNSYRDNAAQEFALQNATARAATSAPPRARIGRSGAGSLDVTV
jgi:predicted alpha/beta hydrolase